VEGEEKVSCCKRRLGSCCHREHGDEIGSTWIAASVRGSAHNGRERAFTASLLHGYHFSLFYITGRPLRSCKDWWLWDSAHYLQIQSEALFVRLFCFFYPIYTFCVEAIFPKTIFDGSLRKPTPLLPRLCTGALVPMILHPSPDRRLCAVTVGSPQRRALQWP